MRRLELESPGSAHVSRSQPPQTPPLIPDVELDSPVLPRDHPQWIRDAVALSDHARRWISRLQPLAIRVLGFWDHAVRCLRVAGRQVSVDPAGCYRVD